MGTPDFVTTCGGCGSRFDRRGWATLTLVERILPAEIHGILRDWSDQFCIEVRRCRFCGREIAAKGAHRKAH